MYRHNIGVRVMSIVCSTCAITDNRICLHISVKDREDTSRLYATAYGLVSAEELNKIEREANY